MRHATIMTVATLTCAVVTAGCQSGGHTAAPAAPTASSSTTSTTATVDPTQSALDDALHSYYLARQTLAAMEESPKKTLAEYPYSLKITDRLADPFLSESLTNGASLVAEGLTFKATLGLGTPKAVAVDLPNQTIVLRHCNSDEKLTAYAHGKEVALTPEPGTAPPPHRVTFTMVQSHGLWKLSKLVSDGKTTCHSD